MRRRLTVHRPAPGHAPSNRVAWWLAFLTTLALIVLLNAVRADAATLPGPGSPFPLFAGLEPEGEPEEELTEEEEEEAGLGEGEAEETEGGFAEECDPEEEVECVEEAEDEGPPRECRLASTSATVSAYPRTRRVVLTVRYSARTSTRVEVSYRLRGSRGGLRMNAAHGRFAGAGSFRAAQAMSAAQMTRVLGAKSFAIEIRPLGAPAYCHAYFDQRLTVRRATPHGPVWAG